MAGYQGHRTILVRIALQRNARLGISMVVLGRKIGNIRPAGRDRQEWGPVLRPELDQGRMIIMAKRSQFGGSCIGIFLDRAEIRS
jgi:hypothetical protein